MAAENPNFSARPEQVEGKWKSLTLAFRKCCDHNSISGNDRKECPFYREIAELYGYRPNVRPYATSGSSGKADYVRPQTEPHLSEPAIFVAEVVKRPKNPLTFSGIRQQAHQNSQNIRNVRSFGKRKLTNSGIYSYS